MTFVDSCFANGPKIGADVSFFCVNLAFGLFNMSKIDQILKYRATTRQISTFSRHRIYNACTSAAGLSDRLSGRAWASPFEWACPSESGQTARRRTPGCHPRLRGAAIFKWKLPLP